MKKPIVVALFMILVFGPVGFAHDDDGIPISFLLKNSDLIVEGIVLDVNMSTEFYQLVVSAEKTYLGTGASGNMSVDLPLNSERRAVKDGRYVLFLKNDNGKWSVLYSFNSDDTVFKSDFENVMQKYVANTDLFSKESISELKELFFSLNHKDMIHSFLYEIQPFLTADDLPFLQTLFESGNTLYKSFSIRRMGDLKLDSMRTLIEKELASTSNDIIILSCIYSLGHIGNRESYPVLSGHLHSQNTSIQRNAIGAAGLLKEDSALEPLKEIYAQDVSSLTKLAIITAVIRIAENNEIVETLNYFLTIENKPFLVEHLAEKIKEFEIK
ncbi:HEAT repeat domain-containing protein [candidate division KSB1 bacterium]